MSTDTRRTRYYFSTRDLLMMAALAALGGVSSTYINAIGDFMQSIFGFAGTTQWAAGLHVLWLTLAMGLVGKPGTGTVTGILKGMVELLSGNTHGILVLLVDVVAGVLVDVGFLPFRRKERWPAYVLTGGLAAASNVFVFQLFAALPADILAYGAMLLIGGVAGLSGVIFAGILAWTLLNTLREAGVVKDTLPVAPTPRHRAIAIGAGLALTILLFAYLRVTLQGPSTIDIAGAVASPYAYPAENGDLPTVTVVATLRDVPTRYTGVPLRGILAQAEPEEDAALILVQATDGYAFFITMEEVRTNDRLILVVKGKEEDAAYDVVGAESSKAWVRNVARLTVVEASSLEITGALDAPSPYVPSEWQNDMDSTNVALPTGAQKLQGTPLGLVLTSMEPQPEAATVVLHTRSQAEMVTLDLGEVMDDDDIRIFTVILGGASVPSTGSGSEAPTGAPTMSYAVARMTGEVLAAPVSKIEVR